MSWSDIFRFAIIGFVLTTVWADDEKSSSGDFELPVPVGMPVNGIKVPQFAEDGRRIMLFEAAEATKVDEHRVEMKDLKLEALDSDGKKIFVELPEAVFNLDTRILTGEKSAKIHREDFEITGESIEFNTKTRFGTMRGEVKMVISTEENSK